MLNCEQVTRLVSESFDRNLTLRERLGLRLHTMMCGTCRVFRQLQHRIHEAIVTCARGGSTSTPASQLPDDARTRIGSAVQAALDDRQSS